VDVLSLDKYW